MFKYFKATYFKKGETKTIFTAQKTETEVRAQILRNNAGGFFGGDRLTEEEMNSILIEEVPNDFVGDFDYKTAYAAKQGTSFTPEHRAYLLMNDWISYMEADRDKVKQWCGEDWVEEFTRYHKKALELYKNWLHSQSRLISPMVTGASNFPARQMEKYNNWADNHYKKFTEFRERAMTAIRRKASRPVDPVKAAPEKLAYETLLLERMKKANKVVRGKGTNEEEKVQQIITLGFSEFEARKCLTPDFMGNTGFPGWAITNCRNRIKTAQAAVSDLQTVKSSGVETLAEGDGWKIVIDPTAGKDQDGRIQVFFDDKPDEKLRRKLKSRPYSLKWSPFYGAWQRQITENAKRFMEQLAKEL